MIEIVDCSSWQTYDGIAEGSGRSEKQWLVSDEGRIGLFKYPKTSATTRETTYEHVSEHLASRIGTVLEVPTADVDLGIRDGRMGSISYLLVKDDEMLVEGLHFILGKHPHYDSDLLLDTQTNDHYCMRHIFEAINDGDFNNYWIQMLLFDFLIGNSDRHQNNWALILYRQNGGVRIRPCPLYDNGSSLCCFVREDQLQGFLGKDVLKFQSLVDTKSRSLVRIDPTKKKRPTHTEVVRYLLSKYPHAGVIANSFLGKLDENRITELVSEYPSEILSLDRKALLKKYLQRKVDILGRLVMESENV